MKSGGASDTVEPRLSGPRLLQHLDYPARHFNDIHDIFDVR